MQKAASENEGKTTPANNPETETDTPKKSETEPDSTEVPEIRDNTRREANNNTTVPENETPQEEPRVPETSDDTQAPRRRQSPETQPEETPNTPNTSQTTPETATKENKTNFLSKTWAFLHGDKGSILKWGQKTNKKISESIQLPEKGSDFNPPQDLGVVGKDLLDGTFTNIARQYYPLIKADLNILRSTWRTITRPFFHPIKTLKSPLRYLSNPVRILTADFRRIKDTLRIPISFTSSLYNKVITRPLDFISTKIITKIPLLDVIFKDAIVPIVKLPDRGLNGLRKFYDGITGWVDKMDDAVGKKQNQEYLD